MAFILRTLVTALAFWVALWFLPGMGVDSSSAQMWVGDESAGNLIALLLISLVFGLVNAVVGPIVKMLALPITCLTLGLFTIIINAAMLSLTEWLTGFLPVHLYIDQFFWTAILGSIIISLVSALANRFIDAVATGR